MLAGKRILITGVATPESIALATARTVLELGGRVGLTAFPRDHRAATELAAELDRSIPVYELDLCNLDQRATVTAAVGHDFGGIDGALHAVAFAPAPALTGDLTETDPAAVELAFRTSTWTLAALAGTVRELAPPAGASLVGLDFDANDGAWPVYNWMGVCKAALRATARYLARDLGAAQIRVNLVAAGPIETRAGTGIPDFGRLLDAWATTAPLPWDTKDASPVADAACFLLSDHARGITGEILHVDGGYHAMAAPIRPSGSAISILTGTGGASV